MHKNYSAWHIHAAYLQHLTKDSIPQFHERDLWWCSLGLNIGDEEDGKNSLFEWPVVIIRKFNRNLFIALPLTTRLKSGIFYFTMTSGGKKAAVILSQVRLLDARRLQRRIGEVSVAELDGIKRAFESLVGKDYNEL